MRGARRGTKLPPMLAAALLASLLAQAEQAPAGPARRRPSAAAPRPPSPGRRRRPHRRPPRPARPRPRPPPPAAAPQPLRGRTAPPPIVAEPDAATPNSVSVQVRYAYRRRRRRATASALRPACRWAASSSAGCAPRERHRAGPAIDFFYDRLRQGRDRDRRSDPMTGPELTITTRTLSQTSFALMETTGLAVRRHARCSSRSAAGLTVGYFGSPESRRAEPDRRAAAGARRLRLRFRHRPEDRRHPARRLHPHLLPSQLPSSARPATPTRCSAISSTPASASSSVSEMARRTAAVALLIVPAVGLGALGLVIVASAGRAPGPPGLGAPDHFAFRQAIGLVVGGVLGAVVVRVGIARVLRAAPALFWSRCSRRPRCSSRASACAPPAPAAGYTSDRSRAVPRRS